MPCDNFTKFFVIQQPRDKGVDDNASGIGVLLEAAERLKDIDTPYSIRFIDFGSEEVGMRGSNYYANNMSAEEIAIQSA